MINDGVVFDLAEYALPRLAYTIGIGQSSVKHARKLAEVYDSDLIRCRGCSYTFYAVMTP